MRLKPINYIEIKKIIHELKGKLGRVDCISAKALKILHASISEYLAHIIFLWPEVRKKAEIVPIHKAYVTHCIQ